MVVVQELIEDFSKINIIVVFLQELSVELLIGKTHTNEVRLESWDRPNEEEQGEIHQDCDKIYSYPKLELKASTFKFVVLGM